MFLPHADGAETNAVVERLVERIEHDLPMIDGVAVRVGATMGTAVSPEDGDNLEALALAADRRLYLAKAQRNESGTGLSA